jgi:flagellar hook-length control protein FliK
MSSARIHALKGGIEVLAGAAATHRGGNAGDLAAGFAAALGATAANFHAPASPHHSHGSDDAATSGDDQTGAPATDDTSLVGNTAVTATDTAGANTAAPAAALPGLSGWFAATGHQIADGTPAPAGQRGPVKPSAAAVGAAAAAVAASLAGAAASVAPTAAPIAAAPPAAVTTTAAAATPAAAGTPPVQQSVLSAAEPIETGFGSSLPANPGSLTARPHASIGTVSGAQGPDAAMPPPALAGAPAVPGITVDPSIHASTPGLADPSAPVVAADLSAAAPSQAAPIPVPSPASHIDAPTWATVAPAAMALVNPLAPTAGGSNPRDFADTARDGQAEAAAAFGGIAAASPTTAGAVGTPGAAAASTPHLGGDAGASNVAAQLSGQVLRLLANSGNEAVVHLHPPDLGEVTLRVAVSGRDVSAWFGSPQPEVQQTITTGLGQLQTDLGNAGYNLNNAWVGADASGSGGRGDSPPPLLSGTIAATALAAPATPVAAALSSNSGVSIYV